MGFAALLLIAGLASAQVITFTGDVATDFAGAQITLDPGGMDVGIPANLAAAIPGVVSGWDINSVAFSYHDDSDTLFVGIDTFGIAGDADGNGDGGVTDPSITANGGIDSANFGGTESFTFGMDLNSDGIIDFVAGVPAGADLSGFTVAVFDGTVAFPGQAVLSDPYNRFGATLPANVGPIPAMPVAGAGDIEFTIPNFSAITAMFGVPTESIGLHVFMGSLEDDGIGEDFLPALVVLEVAPPECFPIPNNWLIGDPEVLMNGDISYPTEFGLLDGYGCCLLFSLFLNPIPFPIVSVPNQPIVLIGDFNVANSIGVIDYGVPPMTGHPVNCKVNALVIPAGLLPSGIQIFTQVLGYPTNPVLPFFTSQLQIMTIP